MDHHGYYTDLNSSFSSITNSSNFSDNNLPSISNYKYQQPTLSGSLYQQPVQTLPDHQQQQQHQHQQQIPLTIKQQIPQTQININNCNNNIFFPPHDDGLFDSNTSSSSCAAVSSNINNNNTSNQKNNNIIGYVRKAESGGENITYNINNINTNIVNNINNNNNTTTNSSSSTSSNSTHNPVGLVNGGDIYGGNNQYHHQINKNGETIINFTNNNNLNHNNTNNSSMPSDSVSASSQNYYYHSNQSNLGQQTFEASSVHSQNTSTSTNSYLNPILSTNKSMGTTGTGLYHGHQHHHHQSASGTSNPAQQLAPSQQPSNGCYISGNNNSLSHENTGTAAAVASYGDFPESISTAAKIINNFESKNPIKYQTTNRIPSGFYKSDFPASQYSSAHSHHLPPHHGINYGIYSGHPSAAISAGINKMSSHSTANPLHSYENPYPNRVTRKPSPYSTSQYYSAPSNTTPQQAHSLDDSRNLYSRTVIQHPTAAYHHPLPPPPPSHHNYGAYYTNGVNRYSMPYPSYSHYPPNQQPSVRNESCSKSAQNYAKPSGQMVSTSEPPSNYALTHSNVYQPTKKTSTEYYSESPYLPIHYYDDPIGHLNSCAKKASRPKVSSSDVYVPQSTSNLYTDHHAMQQYHHQSGGNVMRNVNYQQPMPKIYNSPYTLPTEPLNSCEHAGYYQNVNYPYKTNEHHQMVKSTSSSGPKMNPVLSSKQFKNYYDFPPQQSQSFVSNLPQYHTMQAKHPEKLKISIDLEDQITGCKIPKMRDVQHSNYPYEYSPYYHPYHVPSRNVPLDGEKNQINLRDFLSSWNEIDEDDEGSGVGGGVEKRHQTHSLGILEELNEHVEHVERSIMREFNPMFGQKPHDSITDNLPDVVVDIRKQLTDSNGNDNGVVNESAPKKLYVLESIEVPISELNKYKHLSVINKLPENVVPIEADKEFYDVESSMKFIDEIESNHEKYYKNDFDEEVDFYQQTESKKQCMEPLSSKIKSEPMELKEDVNVKSPYNTSQTEVSDNPTSRKSFRKKSAKSAKAPKIKEKILKLKKEKILKPDHRKLRITKKYRKYAFNQRPSLNVKSLKTICIDFVNTSTYRNYFRQQLSVKNKCSKRQLLDDIKKKFNFDSIKKQQSPINQKRNHSVRINSLQEICDNVLKDKPYGNDGQKSQDNSDIDSDSNTDSYDNFEAHSVEIDAENEVEKFLEQCNEHASEKSCNKIEIDDDNDESIDEDLTQVPTLSHLNNNLHKETPIVVQTLKNLCKTMLHDLNVNVVENIIYEPSSLTELCESVIYSNRQYFLIEEVSNVPKLQDLCKVILSETNIFINIDETEDVINNDVSMLSEPNTMENYNESSMTAIEDEPIYMVEDNNAVKLFSSSSENLNSFEKSELFRKIQSVANIDDDDEILKAIGELHRDNDNNECNNNNNCNDVSNMNLAETNELCIVGSVDNTKFDSVTSFMSYANDDLMHSIQYEEIIPIDLKLEQSRKIIESLRCKYFNRKDVKQRRTVIKKLLKKYLRYQKTNRCKLLWQKNIQHFHDKWLKLQTKSLLLQANGSNKINRKLSSSYTNDTILNSRTTNDHHHQIIKNESHKIAKEDTSCYYPNTKSTQHNNDSKAYLNKFDDIDQMENNIPQLPSIFPSINEYKIEQPNNSCQRSASQVKDIRDSKKRKLSFAESLLRIDDNLYSKVDNYNSNGSNSNCKDKTLIPQHMIDNKYRRESNHRSSSDKHRHDRVYSEQKSRHRERSRHRDRSRNRYHDNQRHRSRSNHRDNRHHRSYHRSSRHQHYQHRNDQIMHSEVRRLIIPSYKVYDKNLDIKLETKPYVKIERTEFVDDKGKHYI